MDKQQRKAATASFKERKPVSGVFAVICSATGAAWVGTSRNLEAQQRGLFFALRQGGSPFATLQAACTAHGERDFRFEELDRLTEDFSDLLRGDELKKRQKLWAERLQAERL